MRVCICRIFDNWRVENVLLFSNIFSRELPNSTGICDNV